jgi:uncharacterized protein (DUF2164 family)
MSEQVKQEGEFKIKAKKPSPRKLNKTDEPIKVDLTQKQEEPIKVIIPKEETNAIQEQGTDESVLRDKQSEVGLQEVVEGNKGAAENVIEEILEQEIKQEVADIKEELQFHTQEQTKNNVELPENIEKLVSFMHETGGTIEDYVRLNADYSNVNNVALLKEYYKNTKPHLDAEEVEFLLEDKFFFDEDIDDEREIKLKKLAFKDEISKARTFLEESKKKYYAEIKARPGVNAEQQKAVDFFNRYNNEQNKVAQQQDAFKKQTSSLFNNEFKGFEYNLGEKRFRYNVQNPNQVAETQSNIQTFIGKFLDKEGNVTDVQGYHKALYSAMNADKIAAHFYEQGKADAVKQVVSNSKNPSMDAPRTASEPFINGFRVKSISSEDTSKLRIQTKKF